MFCVMTCVALPLFTRSATALCPAFGFTVENVSSIAKRRRQASRRISFEETKSRKSIGAIFVQMPPGARQSGLPDSADMPAPVKTTVRRDARNIPMRDVTSSLPAGSFMSVFDVAAIGRHPMSVEHVGHVGGMPMRDARERHLAAIGGITAVGDL